MKPSAAAAVLLRVFLTDPQRRRYGWDLMQDSGLSSGALYPILARLEAAAWVTRTREERVGARPQRCYYRLTPDGANAAEDYLRAVADLKLD